jgi:hypothetical protein
MTKIMTMAMNVDAKRSENERVPNALLLLSLASSGSDANDGGVGTKPGLGAGVGKSPPKEKTVGAVPVVLATVESTDIDVGRSVHSPTPSSLDAISQYASNPSQVFMHLAVIHKSFSPSHSSKAAMLDAA